jgi:hypothetical protein
MSWPFSWIDSLCGIVYVPSGLTSGSVNERLELVESLRTK